MGSLSIKNRIREMILIEPPAFIERKEKLSNQPEKCSTIKVGVSYRPKDAMEKSGARILLLLVMIPIHQKTKSTKHLTRLVSGTT